MNSNSRPEEEEDGFILVRSSRNKQELLIKQHLLGSNGIPAAVKLAPEERHTRGWGMPVGMEDLEKLFHLYVPRESAEEAGAILDSAAGFSSGNPARAADIPQLLLLDPDHLILTEPEGLPLEAVDEAADPKPFSYLFSFTAFPGNADTGRTYQVFLANRPADRIKKVPAASAWRSLKDLLAGNHPAVDPAGLKETYCEGLLRGYCPPAEIFGAERFGGTPRIADTLAGLIRDGKKTATTSLAWGYEAEGISPPAPGDVTVVLDGGGMPAAVIRTVSTAVRFFGDVGAEHARAEGEGDLSREGWRKSHWKWFSRESRELGKEPSETMPVICEEFELLKKL